MDSTSISHKRLEGKVAIITGGASGIGASTAKLFLEHGAKVVIADIQDNLGQAMAQKLSSIDHHKDICYVHCDVSDEDQVINLVNTTLSTFGQLDIMYNNAGIMDQASNNDSTSLLATEKKHLEKMLSTNLIGSFLGAKHAAKSMVQNKKGCIIFTASACTEISGIASAAYSASKYGILGLSKTLAVELGFSGIRVNCLSPFGVLTGSEVDGAKEAMFNHIMGQVGNLKGRILKAEDIAKAALFLASDDEAGYVSGVNLVVDGGYSVVNPSLMNIAMMQKKV